MTDVSRTRAMAAGGPEATTRHFLAAAASGRPNTGADMNAQLRALPCSASLALSAGSTVAQLTNTVPARPDMDGQEQASVQCNATLFTSCCTTYLR